MRCDEAQNLLDAHVDGELDLVHSLAIDEHLAACPECAARKERVIALRGAIASAAPRYTAPPALAARLAASVSKPALVPPHRPAIWRWLAIAASLLVAAALGWQLSSWQSGRSSTERETDELVSNHVRSLLAGHLVDVASSDRHTVKPWFAGQVDFAPQVVDLKEPGTPLVGGRVDLLDGRRAAALVYRHGQHVINLFQIPNDHLGSTTGAPRASDWRGFHILTWSNPDLRFWAISDAGEEELREFVVRLSEGQAAKPK